MAKSNLTEEEYTFIVGLEKDLKTRAQKASPRAMSHLQMVAKFHSDFLAREEGKRSESQRRDAAKAEREALRLQKQQERLQKTQERLQELQKPGSNKPKPNA
jgi:hypothetical protein